MFWGAGVARYRNGHAEGLVRTAAVGGVGQSWCLGGTVDGRFHLALHIDPLVAVGGFAVTALSAKVQMTCSESPAFSWVGSAGLSARANDARYGPGLSQWSVAATFSLVRKSLSACSMTHLSASATSVVSFSLEKSNTGRCRVSRWPEGRPSIYCYANRCKSSGWYRCRWSSHPSRPCQRYGSALGRWIRRTG